MPRDDARILDDLFAVIAARRTAAPEGSYTAELFAGGVPLASRKLGEEATETLVAAMEGDTDAVVRESADLLYHWLVLLAICGVDPAQVYAELARRAKGDA